MTLADSTVLLASGGKATGFTVLVDRCTDPVHSSVTTDGLVGRINQNDLKVLVGSVLRDPVRVEDSQVGAFASDSLFGNRLGRSLKFELVHTLVNGLAVGGTLGGHSLAVTSSNTDSVDNKALLGLVAETTGLVRAGGRVGSVDDVQLTVLPASDAEKETEDIRLLLLEKFFQILLISCRLKLASIGLE